MSQHPHTNLSKTMSGFTFNPPAGTFFLCHPKLRKIKKSQLLIISECSEVTTEYLPEKLKKMVRALEEEGIAEADTQCTCTALLTPPGFESNYILCVGPLNENGMAYFEAKIRQNPRFGKKCTYFHHCF